MKWMIEIDWKQLKSMGVAIGLLLLFGIVITMLGVLLYRLIGEAISLQWCVNIIGGIVCIALCASLVIKIRRKDKDGEFAKWLNDRENK